jgi:hypothetical protein
MRTDSSPNLIVEFVDGRCGLAQLVPYLVRANIVFDDAIKTIGPLQAAIYEQVESIISRAPYNLHAAYEMHSVLNALYSMRLSKYGSIQEFSVSLFEVRRLLEAAWLNSELERCAGNHMPGTGTDFREWFFAQSRSHPAARHALYEYIAHEASLSAFSIFVSHESTVDARFDDLLAMVQLGFTGEPKLEVARNYWDELGEGEANRVHTTMFNRVFDAVGLTIQGDQELDSTALACGNLLLVLATYRSYSYYAIGALGITEALAPSRFTRVLKAGERLRIDSGTMEYFREHVSIDEHHTNQWIENVIEPTLRATPSALHQVCCGVLMRLNTSVAYCEALLRRLKSADCVAIERNSRAESIRTHG